MAVVNGTNLVISLGGTVIANSQEVSLSLNHDVIDVTTKHPFDYRYGFGIRKLGRFGYERKPDNFWTGNVKREKQNALGEVRH